MFAPWEHIIECSQTGEEMRITFRRAPSADPESRILAASADANYRPLAMVLTELLGERMRVFADE